MSDENQMEPSIEDILEAQEYLKGKIFSTPVECSSTFSNMYGAPIYFKLENFQKTGSFKTRGALFKISKLTPQEQRDGVIACSAGNHAQGVAYAGRLAKVSSKIVMPSYTISAKINAVKAYGADVILYGNSYAEAFQEARRLSQIEKRTFIDGFNDRWIIAGQGTIGLEILEKHPDVENIIVPVGGGGLISGIAKAVKSMNDKIKIIGVQSENCDSVVQTIKRGEYTVSSKGFTIADGIAVQNPGKLNIEMIRKYVDQLVTVSDESMAYALFKLLERHKILVEPSAASPLAAIMEKKVNLGGKKTVGVASGGNIDLLLLSKIIYKAMEMDKGLVRIECKIPDRPGTLQAITSTISSTGGNIFHAEVDNLSYDTPPGYQSITFSINLRDSGHLEVLLKKLGDLGYKFHVSSV